VNHPSGFVEIKFNIVNKAEEGDREFSVKVPGVFSHDRGPLHPPNQLLQSGKGGCRIVPVGEGGNLMGRVQALAGDAVGSLRAGSKLTILNPEIRGSLTREDAGEDQGHSGRSRQ